MFVQVSSSAKLVVSRGRTQPESLDLPWRWPIRRRIGSFILSIDGTEYVQFESKQIEEVNKVVVWPRRWAVVQVYVYEHLALNTPSPLWMIATETSDLVFVVIISLHAVMLVGY